MLLLDTLQLNLVLGTPVVCGEDRSVSIFLFRCKYYPSNEALHYGHKISERTTSHIICTLTFKRRIKSHLPFAGIIRSSLYSARFQDKG